MGDGEPDAPTFRLPRVATPEAPLRLAVLISGSGTGLQALLEHQRDRPECGHRTVVVISDDPQAQGLERAESFGIAALAVPLPPLDPGTGPEARLARRAEHEDVVEALLLAREPDLIALSGYMRLLSDELVGRWAGRLVNIHPSLLPAFPGAHAHRDALAHGAKVSGCTVHFVDAGMDSGPIIAQQAVPVHSGDTEATLEVRVQAVEHALYPRVLDALAAGRISVAGRAISGLDSN